MERNISCMAKLMTKERKIPWMSTLQTVKREGEAPRVSTLLVV
jgi:hypothetical protein